MPFTSFSPRYFPSFRCMEESRGGIVTRKYIWLGWAIGSTQDAKDKPNGKVRSGISQGKFIRAERGNSFYMGCLQVKTRWRADTYVKRHLGRMEHMIISPWQPILGTVFIM